MAVHAPAPAPLAAGTSLLDMIGNTPLLRITRLFPEFPGVEILGKAEYMNPGGSVKDRPALNMILDGERTGRLTPARIILDATSGNTGIAYAMIAAHCGYQARMCVPMNASPERIRILRGYGADLELTPAGEGTDGAIRRCREIYEADPDLYFYPDQYNNPANWRAHFETTGVEILHQTHRRVTHFVAGLGTSGSFMGVTRRLKYELPRVVCISVQPSSPFHGLEGMKHMPSAIVPGIYDPSLADENLWIDTEDAYAMVRRAGRVEGLLIGISAGANLVAAGRVARRLHEAGQSGTVVTILCDGAVKYLSEHFWDE